MEKIIVIHPGCITGELQNHSKSPFLTDNEVKLLGNAMDLINVTVASARKPFALSEKTDSIPLDADVYVLAEDDTSLVARCVTPEDDVTLLGAYRNICVRNAKKTIKKVGAKVTVSKEGTILSY